MVRVLLMLIVFIYAYLCQTQFPFHLMFVSFNSKTTGATRGAEIAYLSGSPEITPVIFSETLVVHSLVFCVVFCRPLFVFVAIALFVLLGFTTSDYPVVIFTFLMMYF